VFLEYLYTVISDEVIKKASLFTIKKIASKVPLMFKFSGRNLSSAQ